MRDEDILSKYKDIIDKDIAKYCEKYKIENNSDIEIFAQKYKKNFITGFHEGLIIGRKLASETVAINLLKTNLLLDSGISKVTGLSLEKIQSLRK